MAQHVEKFTVELAFSLDTDDPRTAAVLATTTPEIRQRLYVDTLRSLLADGNEGAGYARMDLAEDVVEAGAAS
jgi:hypothetical protein